MPGMDAELLGLYLRGDAAGVERARELVAGGRAWAPRDLFHAAHALMQSSDPADRWRAYELARDAAQGGFASARPLAAANYDAWLVLQGKPQKYGTQWKRAEDGEMVLHEVDPATTDAERDAWGVPPPHVRRPAFEPSGRDVITTFTREGSRLEIHELPDAAPPDYAIRPVEPDDPLPGWLPAGLSPRRFGREWCALDAAGRIAALWRRCGWRADPPDHAPNQDVEMWIGVNGESFAGLAQQSGATSCWLIEGELSREETRRLARSLPRD